VSTDEEGRATATARTQGGDLLATTSAGTKYYHVVGVGVGVVKLAIMQLPSDCDGIAIFRISTLAQFLSKSDAI
jgi:hypothetical protein